MKLNGKGFQLLEMQSNNSSNNNNNTNKHFGAGGHGHAMPRPAYSLSSISGHKRDNSGFDVGRWFSRFDL
jgi:hypothetical protein